VVSRSHGTLPSLPVVHHAHPTGRFPRDVYPKDSYGVGIGYIPGTGHSRVPSSTASLDRHQPLEHSSTDSDSDSSSSRIDTMYGDEDRHHKPLYSALGDVNEDPREEDEDGTQDVAGERMDDEEDKAPEMKRSGTFSKLSTMFKHKKLSDDENCSPAPVGRSKTERIKKRKRKKNKKAKSKSPKHHGDVRGQGPLHHPSSSEDASPAPRRKGPMAHSMMEMRSAQRGHGDDDENQPLKH